MARIRMPTQPTARWMAWGVAVAFVGMAWWPMRLELPSAHDNGAVRGGATVTFARDGLLRGDPAALLAALRATGACVVELTFTPATGNVVGPARLLELGQDHDTMNLMVGQNRTDLVVRVRRPGSDPAGAPPLVVNGTCRAGVRTTATITIGRERLAVAVDGREREVLPLNRPPLEAWDDACTLTLGDSPAGARGWHGSLERAVVEVGAQSFDLLDPAATVAPATLWTVPERLQLSATYGFWSPASPRDLLLNVLGFVPVGILAALGARRRTVLAALRFGFALSLVMELGQVAFADRVPSFLDLMLNTTGAVLGGIWAAHALDRRAA